MITKCHNHHHFWVADCVLYEAYSTIRGLRYREICEVLYPDTEKLTDEQLKHIEDAKG